MLTKLLVAPWQYYTRAAAFTFTAVLTTNFCTTIYDQDRRLFLKTAPSIVTSLIVGKSLLFAPIWPAWYLTMAIRPRSAFFLGGGQVTIPSITYNTEKGVCTMVFSYEDGKQQD
jgi:hypothetical protein